MSKRREIWFGFVKKKVDRIFIYFRLETNQIGYIMITTMKIIIMIIS